MFLGKDVLKISFATLLKSYFGMGVFLVLELPSLESELGLLDSASSSSQVSGSAAELLHPEAFVLLITSAKV